MTPRDDRSSELIIGEAMEAMDWMDWIFESCLSKQHSVRRPVGQKDQKD